MIMLCDVNFRTLKELQHDLCNPRDSEVLLIDSHSQDYHASKFMI